MTSEEILVPALSAASGGFIAGFALKLILQSWFKRHDEVATKVDAMVVQLTRVEERVNVLQRLEDRAHTQNQILEHLQKISHRVCEDRMHQ